MSRLRLRTIIQAIVTGVAAHAMRPILIVEDDDVLRQVLADQIGCARLQTQLRLFDTSDNAVFDIGPYTFYPAAKLLVGTDKKQRLRLTAKEVDILKFLHRHANRIVSREVLLGEVWGYNGGVTTHTLETHVYRLRQKIEIDPAHSRLLLTAAGGYRLDPTPN